MYPEQTIIDYSVRTPPQPADQPQRYDGHLLTLSIDLGERLMPAFETKTSIPYGTVNLRYGVPSGETKIASTAGAGSLLVEFQVLSCLCGQAKFGEAAFTAMKALYQRRSPIGLLGKHINTETGHWSESLSGVGSNADSFYEYLLKAYLLFRNKEVSGAVEKRREGGDGVRRRCSMCTILSFSCSLLFIFFNILSFSRAFSCTACFPTPTGRSSGSCW